MCIMKKLCYAILGILFISLCVPFFVSAGQLAPSPFNAGGQLDAGWANMGSGKYYNSTLGIYSNADGSIQSYTSEIFSASTQGNQIQTVASEDTMQGICIWNNYDKTFQPANDQVFATRAVADQMAQRFGGTVIEIYLSTDGPYRTVNICAFPAGQTTILQENLVPEYTVKVGNYRGNAAAINHLFQTYPYSTAFAMVKAEIDAANNTSGGGGSGNGGGGSGTGGGTTPPVITSTQGAAVEVKIKTMAQRMAKDYFDAYNRASGLTRNTTTIGGSGGLPTTCQRFDNNLKLGDTGPDVLALTQILKMEGLLNETTDTFDQTVFRAVVLYQERYAEEILVPAGLTAGTGLVGTNTREHLNSLCEEVDDTDSGSVGNTDPVVNLVVGNNNKIAIYSVGETIPYTVTMTNVNSVSSFYNTIPKDTCVGGSTNGEQKPWIVSFPVSNSVLSETVKSCQAGSTYIISVIGTNTTTGKISASSVSVYIRP